MSDEPGEAMADSVYRPHVVVERHGGPQRTATMPAGEQVRFGYHSAVAEHYGRKPGEYEPVSTTIDYIVAAAVG